MHDRMGLTTQYLRFVPGPVCGIIGTGRCVRFITRFSQTGKYVAVPACENVIIWDTRKSTKVLTLKADNNKIVTVLEPRPPSPRSVDNTHLIVGYSDGSVFVFDLVFGQPLKFVGHRTGVSAVAWDHQGMRAASASHDGEIVIWDIVSEKGIVRLRGHRGGVTRLHFFHDHEVLASSSHDTFIKFWDLATNHCFRTLTGHRAEVWDFILMRNDSWLISGSSDAELRVWSLEFSDLYKGESENAKNDLDEGVDIKAFSKYLRVDSEGTSSVVVHDSNEEEVDDASILKITPVGRILRSRSDRLCGLITDGCVVACYGKSHVIDLFQKLSEEEVKKKVARRLKKARKRARKTDSEDAAEYSDQPQLSDEIRKLATVNTKFKLSAVDGFSDSSGNISLMALHSDNSLALYGSEMNAKEDKQLNEDSAKIHLAVVDKPGHRTEVRAVAFNSIGDQIISASSDCIKLWHRSQVQAVTTVPCEYVVSLVVVPGDRHVLVGCLSGHIQLFDLGSASLQEDVEAHLADDKGQSDDAVWGLALTHDGRGFISGGNDCLVKFWKFELVREDESKRKRLSFIQDSRALKVADQVTCVRCSKDGRYLAVATLDLKETLYYTDTLKLCHELYGKSLPSTCLDFSTDATLIVTGSKDTCLRIYGTDFGDQHRMIKNAHQGGVTDVQFLPKTHMFFSCGHDGEVKQWDADNFQRIITLQGHSGIVRCLAVCPKGAWVVSCGQDRTIRLWERTQEPLVLEDEREEERRREEEEKGDVAMAVQRPVVLGEDSAQAVRPSVTTHQTEKAVDMLLEALTIYREQVDGGDKAVPNDLMTLVYNTRDPLKFVLEVLRKIKSSELEETLLVLPLQQILELLVVSCGLLRQGLDVELVSRIVVMAIRINLPHLLASQKAVPIIRSLAKLLRQRTEEMQDMVGFNLSALQHMQHRIEQRTEVQLFAEAAASASKARQKKKRKEQAARRALLVL